MYAIICGASNFSNSDTQLFLTELVKSLSSKTTSTNKFPMLGNVIPDFDPMIEGQTIHMWLHEVEECARLHSWSGDRIVHCALPELCGVARAWCQALSSISFPSSDDCAELLCEVLFQELNAMSRMIRLICLIPRAVDCLLHGIGDRSVRLGAGAEGCEVPEKVLSCFQSIEQQSRGIDGSEVALDRKVFPSSHGIFIQGRRLALSQNRVELPQFVLTAARLNILVSGAQGEFLNVGGLCGPFGN